MTSKIISYKMVHDDYNDENHIDIKINCSWCDAELITSNKKVDGFVSAPVLCHHCYKGFCFVYEIKDGKVTMVEVEKE